MNNTASSDKEVTIQVTEKPAQQVQIQNGEQASLCGSSCEVPASEYFPVSSPAKDASSPHCIMLNDRTRIAIMKAKIFFTSAKVVLDLVKDKLMFVSRLHVYMFSSKATEELGKIVVP